MRLLVFIILYYLWKKRQRRRRIQVHPYNATRLLRGAFSTSFADLREHSDKFFKHFRLSITTFDELLCKIEHNLKRSSLRRAPIEPVEKLAITLR
ncbi:unnamed protein product [Pieris macdunnoughi]|uniref:Uncharacterized protein n=2 Tax=Pieris TaxID=7115 RepID=A0A821UIF6_9NEOP|nr:unnamed protein product [Pieris macdunnoughi]